MPGKGIRGFFEKKPGKKLSEKGLLHYYFVCAEMSGWISADCTGYLFP